MKLLVIFLINFLFAVIVLAEECPRPQELLQFEGSCFEEHAGIIEKVQQKATTWFASAKKRLGLAEDNDQSGDQKHKSCGYYQCIFNKMGVNNHHGIPDEGKLKEKYGSALPSEEASINKCFAMPDNIEMVIHNNEESFDAVNAGNAKTTVKEARDTMNQVICEINSHVHQCLSSVMKDSKCPLLVFP